MPAITFKVSKIAYEMLKEEPGLRPAPYLASRGMSWIQYYAPPGLSDADLEAYLTESHRIVSLGLSKKKQKELGLHQEGAGQETAGRKTKSPKKNAPGKSRRR